MTTVNEDTGRILWSQESKYYLVRLIKENIVIASPDVSAETMAKKEEAWKNIEENFAADGMCCQLSKLKRLWKRMKDTARQNIAKYNEQKRRNVKGTKNLKAPSELDLKVAEIIAHRNLAKNKPKLRAKSKMYYNYKSPTNRDSGIGDDIDSFDMMDHMDHRGNDAGDVLEPMTILEEVDSEPSIKEEYPLNIGNGHDDIESNDLMEQYTSETMKDDLDNEFLTQDEQLRELQRHNEEERMNMERELFRKKSILLDLQIKKANLELDYLMRSN